MSELKACADTHQQIMYYGEECPLCIARDQMNEILDAKTDIEMMDIYDLYDLHKYSERRLKRIEKHLGLLPPKRHWWSGKKVTQTSAQPTPAEATF